MAIVTLRFFSLKRSDLGAVTSAPTGVSSIVSGYRLVSFWDVTGELSKELESVKFVSCSLLGGVGYDVVL